MPLISQKAVEAAFDYFADAPDAVAQARYQQILAERKVKRTYAELFLEAEGRTDALRKAWVEVHPDYNAACQEEAEAVRAVEWHKWQRARCEATLDAWRTEQSNMRQTFRAG